MSLNSKSDKPTWFDKNPKRVIFLFLALIILIFLFGIEYVLEQKFNIQSNPKQRYVQIREVLPDTDTIGASDNVNKDFVRVRTDSNGLLLPGKIHDDADITLFFIGSSTIMTVTLDEKERLPYVTGNMLEKKTKNKVNSYNGAYSSSTSFHGLNMLINKVIPYKPDYLIFMYNAVDLIKLRLSPNYYWETNYVTTSAGSIMNALRGVKNRLFPNIYYVLNTNLNINIGGYIRGLFNSLGFDTKIIKKEHLKKTFKDMDFEIAKDKYTKNLESIIAICKIHDIVPVILTEPWNLKEIKKDKNIRDLGLDDFVQYHNTFNTIIENTGRDEGVILVDLFNKINDKRSELFVGKYHFSLDGVKEESDLITKVIIKHREKYN